jgi:hypothetical protein
MTSDLPADWMAFKKATCKAKCKHFDERINEITHTNLRPWDLIDWVIPCKTPPIKAISYQGVPCTSLDQLWNTLHSTFNSALDRLSVLGNKWESPSIRARIPYSAVEMSDALMGTSWGYSCCKHGRYESPYFFFFIWISRPSFVL